MPVYAFDGTWNEAKDGDDPHYTNTNVFRFYGAYKRHSKRPDLDFYVPGVGTRFKAIGRALGGVFGLGELPRINEAYEALCKAWDQGERDIDIVGFSRGAATTLDFCHCIQNRGIRNPGSHQDIETSPKSRFLGVWDTVMSLGSRFRSTGSSTSSATRNFHADRKPAASVQHARQALAVDEKRFDLRPEVWSEARSDQRM